MDQRKLVYKRNKSVYKRSDEIWPWGYYIPQREGLKQGEYGCFVAATKADAIKQVNRRQ